VISLAPRIYDRTDLAWSGRGDFIIGHNQDIMDTYEDPLRSLYQEIRTRIKSEVGDWELYPDNAAQLSDFVGEPNDKFTAESIKTRVIASIARNGLVQNSDIAVKYAPIDIDKLMVRVTIKVTPTARNGGSEFLGITFMYDYSENHAFFIG
jgi:hypothetical protein